MTSGQFYEKNQKIYNDEAYSFISENLKEKGDMCHRPFEMMTHYTRTICEKITDDIYLVFEGYVKSIKYSERREIKEYVGKKDDASIYTKRELIRMFGFEISLNPRSESNKLVSLVCDNCYNTDGFYLGTTCPKCKQPFRSVKAN